MSRSGDSYTDLLDDLHAPPDCSGQVFSKCQPIVAKEYDGNPPEGRDVIQVVFMEWCGECGAADWEVV